MKTRLPLGGVAAAALAAMLGCAPARSVVVAAPPPQAAPRPDPATLARASLNGKYEVLLMAMSVPEDVRRYGELYDYGYWPGGTYAGVAGLPPGYWVYLAPTWYLWKYAPQPIRQPPPE